MGKEIFEKRKLEFESYIIKNKRLPKKWEVRFSDGTDMRLWFDSLNKHEKFIDYINKILNEFGLRILTDKEKEQEFIECINNIYRIPSINEFYFTDNEDMHTWYMNYKINNKDFETKVHNSLKEYQDFDLVTIWPRIKNEFIKIIKIFKRIPEHGEAIIQDGIDVRTIYDKLITFDPELVEQISLHLMTYNKNNLSVDERIDELLKEVKRLGYIPYLQESRFSDKTDMFTWYKRYKNIVTDLESRVERIIKKSTNTNVNIYLIPNFKTTGGKFYTVCSNVGERLDISNINSFEEAKKLDNNLVKRGGIILKQNEEIDTVNYSKGKNK